MRFDIITIFPKIFDSYFQESLLKKAQEKGLIKIQIHNLRDFTNDGSRSRGDRGSSTKWSGHRKARPTERSWSFGRVDDTPYGGGPGMVLKIEPIAKAVESAKRESQSAKRKRVILFSLRGKKFDQKEAHRLAKYDQLIFICGRYEGVDERVAKFIADEELSIGDYVLSGGELPAGIVIEAVSRLIPGMLGKEASLEEKKGSYPVYTKPESIKLKVKGPMPTELAGGRQERSRVMKVPPVLLSGNHKEIEKWREKNG